MDLVWERSLTVPSINVAGVLSEILVKIPEDIDQFAQPEAAGRLV